MTRLGTTETHKTSGGSGKRKLLTFFITPSTTRNEREGRRDSETEGPLRKLACFQIPPLLFNEEVLLEWDERLVNLSGNKYIIIVKWTEELVIGRTLLNRKKRRQLGE